MPLPLSWIRKSTSAAAGTSTASQKTNGLCMHTVPGGRGAGKMNEETKGPEAPTSEKPQLREISKEELG